METSASIAVTGGSGQLGRLVVAELARIAPKAHVIGLVRDPAKAADLAERGIELRTADYTDPASLRAALRSADRVLLISSSEVGQRAAQHRNVIDAAKAEGVQFIAYTSILHADSNPMALATEHLATEAYLRASGIPFAFLRNGWYTENYTAHVAAALAHGAVLGAARDGRISAAARADYAAAAARVIAGDPQAETGKVYELAGDEAFTLAQYAAELARQSGKAVIYQDLPEAAYASALQGAGLPEAFAQVLADSDTRAAAGALHDEGHALRRLIGRPTTSLSRSIADALAA